MWRIVIGICLAASFFFVSPSFVAQEDCSKSDPSSVRVVKSQFGVFVVVDQQIRLLLTSKIPAIPGTKYGWFLMYDTKKTHIVWREEIVAPKPLDDWGAGERAGAFVVSPDRRTAVTERVMSTDFPLINQEWDIGPNDPPGVYRISIFIDGQKMAEHSLELVPVPGGFKNDRRPRTPRIQNI